MKIQKLALSALCAALLCGLSGCFTSSGETQPALIENVSVTLAPGRSLRQAIMAAALRRRWVPQEQRNGTVRCTLIQREHKVVADVVPNGDSAFSIRFVESNIPVRKYNQWADNLSREIAYQAIQ